MVNRPDQESPDRAEVTPESAEAIALSVEREAERMLRQGDVVGAAAEMARAAELSPSPATRGRQLARAAHFEVQARGARSDAARLLAKALQLDPNLRGSVEVATAASQISLCWEGDIATAHRGLVTALSRSRGRPRCGASVGVQAISEAVRVSIMGGRPELLRAVKSAAANCELQPPAELELVFDLFGGPVGRAEDELEKLGALIGQLEHDDDPMTAARVGFVSLLADQVSRCGPPLRRVLGTQQQGVGGVAGAADIAGALACDAWLSGDLHTTAELAGEAIALAESHGYCAFSAHYARLLLTALIDPRNSLANQANHLVKWAAPRGMAGLLWCVAHARGIAALSRGEFNDAFRHLSAINAGGASGPVVPQARWATLDFVEAAVRSGRPESARLRLAAVDASGFAELSSRIRLLATAAAALVTSGAAAASLFETALDISGAATRPFEYARVQLAYGEWLRRNRSSSQSRQHLESALVAFMGLGASEWAKRAESELRASSPFKPRLPSDEMERLTSRELEISSLAATGLSNKEIAERLVVSPRTVGAHLHRVFRKLGISSRASLRDALNDADTDS